MDNKQPKLSTVLLLIVTIVSKSVMELVTGQINIETLITTLIITVPFLLSMYFGEEKPGVQSLLNIFKTLTCDIALGKMTKAEALGKLEVLIESAVDVWDGIFCKEELKKVKAEIEKEIDVRQDEILNDKAEEVAG